MPFPARFFTPSSPIVLGIAFFERCKPTLKLNGGHTLPTAIQKPAKPTLLLSPVTKPQTEKKSTLDTSSRSISDSNARMPLITSKDSCNVETRIRTPSPPGLLIQRLPENDYIQTRADDECLSREGRANRSFSDSQSPTETRRSNCNPNATRDRRVLVTRILLLQHIKQTLSLELDLKDVTLFPESRLQVPYTWALREAYAFPKGPDSRLKRLELFSLDDHNELRKALQQGQIRAVRKTHLSRPVDKNEVRRLRALRTKELLLKHLHTRFPTVDFTMADICPLPSARPLQYDWKLSHVYVFPTYNTGLNKHHRKSFINFSLKEHEDLEEALEKGHIWAVLKAEVNDKQDSPEKDGHGDGDQKKNEKDIADGEVECTEGYGGEDRKETGTTMDAGTRYNPSFQETKHDYFGEYRKEQEHNRALRAQLATSLEESKRLRELVFAAERNLQRITKTLRDGMDGARG
ncbi:hypothetical protein BJ508DRAFT_315652 [Ascobolus immersus RN42]|uniref:Uncharacterized protein n=1 Tax=Ascobolus immersus RN42 TaxID=1160509 RepID=A0A3N4HP10_ASCIM|nr:hypothetical protein BJ508DRAFT_315652 [Ascobolus immersus RN42]